MAQFNLRDGKTSNPTAQLMLQGELMKKMLFLCFLISFILHGSLFFNIDYTISDKPFSLASRADAIDVKIITSKDSDIGLEQIKDTKNANFSKRKLRRMPKH